MHVRRDMKGRCKDADRSIHSARPAAALDGYRSTSPIDIPQACSSKQLLLGKNRPPRVSWLGG